MDVFPSATYNVQTAEKSFNELKAHLNMERLPITESGRDILQFVLNNQPKDFLIVKPPDNPFKPKSTCMFL